MFKKILNYFRKKDGISVDIQQIIGQFFSSVYNNSFTAAQFQRLCGLTYNSNPDFQEAIHKIYTQCSGLPLCLYDDNNKKIDISDFPKELKAWFKEPAINGKNWNDLLLDCFIQFYISGEIFFLKSLKEKKICLVRPDEVTEIKMMAGRPYKYDISQIFFQRTNLAPADFDLKDLSSEAEYRGGMYVNTLVHFFQANPILPIRGLSPVVTMLDDVQILLRGRQWNRAMLNNSGRPSGVFYYPPKTIGAVEGQDFIGAKKLNEDLKNVFSGSENAGKAVILQGGLQFKEVSYNMKDLDFLSGLKFSRETIASRLGIPLQLFGSEKSSSYNNYKEAREHFQQDTCIPFMNNFLKFISISVLHDLFPEFQKYNLCVDIKKTDHSINKEIEKMVKINPMSFLTVNEKRELSGYERLPDENTDTILVPSSLMPIEDAGVMDTPDSEPEDDENDDEND